MRAKSGIEIKTPDQIEAMRRAGLVVGRTLRILREAVKPGISTADLDEIAAREIHGAGAIPSFLNYHGYPATICTSPNEVIVHGIPRPDAILGDGDIISIDCGAIVDGWHGDAAITVGVGEISPERTRLLEVCETALWQGLAQIRAGNRLTDISHAVEASVRAAGPGAEAAGGHGPGRGAHDRAGPAGHRRAGGRLDRGQRGRQLRGPLRAHRRHHPRRSLGHHRRGWRGGRIRGHRAA